MEKIKSTRKRLVLSNSPVSPLNKHLLMAEPAEGPTPCWALTEAGGVLMSSSTADVWTAVTAE